jgi:hypothetical protein
MMWANIIMVVSALIGMLFIAHHKRIGFAIYMVTEITFWWIGWHTENYGLCVAAVLYFTVNVYSFIKWGGK